MTVIIVCDSAFRNRKQYPLVGYFESEPASMKDINATSDNYSTATPYDFGTLSIAAGDAVNRVSIVHELSIKTEEFYSGHILTIFGPTGIRHSFLITSSFPTSSTATTLTLDGNIQAAAPPPVTVAYWISQSPPVRVADQSTIVDATTLIAPRDVYQLRPENDVRFALLLYNVSVSLPRSPSPWPQYPIVSYVRSVTSFPVHDGEPTGTEQCLVTLADTVPFAANSTVFVDWMKINGVTNGNNVGNARYPTRFLSQSCNSRWPLAIPPSAPNMNRVMLQHVILPAQVPVRTIPNALDSQSLRDSDVLRNGGYITEFPYILVQIVVNQRHRPHTVVVPSQAQIAASFIAIMETFRNNMKPFVVAHCHTPVYIPADEWETVVIWIRLPNGDVVDFDPHPAMRRRHMYAGPDPMTQVQCIFVVECVSGR